MNDSNGNLRRSTRSTRSSSSMAENDEDKPAMKSAFEECPFIEYKARYAAENKFRFLYKTYRSGLKGEIKYYSDYYDIASASDDVINWLDRQVEVDVCPMAFDMEWPFSFQTGPGKSAVIQICVDLERCYVFQLTNLNKLPAALMALLKHPKARLHGVNIKNDFRKLARDFPEVNANDLIDKCVDLGVWCNLVCETGGRWSLDRLSKFIVKKQVDKNKKVRMSKWHVVPLNENQLLYAAIDVYIGQLIYLELDKREKTKEANEENFTNNHGDFAYKAMKALGENFLNSPKMP